MARSRIFRKPMFRIHLYEQKGNDCGGTISLTNEEHKTTKDLTRHFNSLDKIPRAMRKLLKKAKEAKVSKPERKSKTTKEKNA